MTNGRDSHRSLGHSRSSFGRSASLLWSFRRALLTFDFDGLVVSSSKWRRRVLSSARWWSGFALEVGFLFKRFGSYLALPATQNVDGACLEWLSINGLQLGGLTSEVILDLVWRCGGRRGI